MTVKQDVKALQKELKTLEKKIAKLTKIINTGEKGKAGKISKRKSTPRKASVSTASGKITATDRVLDIIKKNEKGVDAASLMKDTGFNATKVRNILSRIFKEGKVKRAGRGIYVAA
jgi:predicted transcriptional regulator